MYSVASLPMNSTIAPLRALLNVPSKYACNSLGYTSTVCTVSGVCHTSLLTRLPPTATAVCGVVQVEEPVDDVDPVDHQVGEDAAAEVPEPAPVSEAVLA